MTSTTDLSTYPTNVQHFVAAMQRTDNGRVMADRVFAQVSGARHANILSDVQIATYLLDNEWTFSDVCKREN